MIESLLAFFGATVLLALSPGPDNIYVVTQSLANGAKAGLATTAGLISGCIVHTTFIAFGMSAVIARSPNLFTAIKIVGALYILFLAYKVYRSDAGIALGNSAPKKSAVSLFKQGVLMNILNPKVTLFFLALFPGFLWEPEGNTVVQFYILGVLFMVTSFIIFGSIALVAGSVALELLHNQRAGKVLKWLQIVVFIGIALFLLL